MRLRSQGVSDGSSAVYRNIVYLIAAQFPSNMLLGTVSRHEMERDRASTRPGRGIQPTRRALTSAAAAFTRSPQAGSLDSS